MYLNSKPLIDIPAADPIRKQLSLSLSLSFSILDTKARGIEAAMQLP